MTATYTFDIFSTLDGYGSYGPEGDWGGNWGKQGAELLDRRLASFNAKQRMVFGATTFRQFDEMLAAVTRVLEEYVARRKQKHLADLMGKLEWDQSCDYKSERSRR